MLAAGTVLAGYRYVRSLTPEQLVSYKPTWWLMWDTRSSDAAVVGPVLRELLSRYEAGSLPDSTVQAIARQGLHYRDQGAPCVLWNWEYGNFLDIAWARGLLSAQERRHYAETASACSGWARRFAPIRMRPRIRFS